MLGEQVSGLPNGVPGAGRSGQADELIGDIMAELRMTLRKMDAASQRRIMRTSGARFEYLRGEEVDPDDNDPIVPSQEAA